MQTPGSKSGSETLDFMAGEGGYNKQGKIASGGTKWKKEEQLVKERWSKKFDFRDKRHA